MKKLLSFLLVGTLAAATAQAVTLDWSKIDGAQSVTTSANTATASSAQMKVAANTAWTASCLLTVSKLGSFPGGHYYPALFGVATGSGATDSCRFYADFHPNTANKGPVILANATKTGTTQMISKGNTYELVLSYDGVGTLSFYFDGTLYGTSSSSQWAGGANPYLVWGKQGPSATNQILDKGAEYTTDIHYVAGKTYTELTVPEPTVLALLAVGVAGLALRRKA